MSRVGPARACATRVLFRVGSEDAFAASALDAEIGAAKLEHEYAVYRDEELLATARSVLACVDAQGQVQRIPDNVAATVDQVD